MDESQQRIIDTTRDLLQAYRAAREAMVLDEQALVKAIGELEQGSRASDIYRRSSAKSLSSLTNETFARVATLRHRLRLLIIRECDDDGMVSQEIAEMCGFSRQRASKFVAESRQLPPET